MKDFLGLDEVIPGGGAPVLENVETVGWFKELFRADYESMSASVESVDRILEIYLHGGEYGHKEYHPVGNFVSGILDVTIIKRFIESIYGYDLITGEKLTDFERGMPVFVKEIQDFSTELDYDADTIVAELAEHGNTNGDISINFIHIKNFIHKNTNRRYIQT